MDHVFSVKGLFLFWIPLHTGEGLSCHITGNYNTVSLISNQNPGVSNIFFHTQETRPLLPDYTKGTCRGTALLMESLSPWYRAVPQLQLCYLPNVTLMDVFGQFSDSCPHLNMRCGMFLTKYKLINFFGTKYVDFSHSFLHPFFLVLALCAAWHLPSSPKLPNKNLP